jgi:NAD(P)H dehydrogenase (quinone)
MTYLLHHGMICVGSPYSVKALHETKSGGTPYGPSHVTSLNNSIELTPHEYDIASATGQRIAKIINSLEPHESA